MTLTTKLSASVIDHPVSGRGLTGSTLGSNLGPDPTLLVFLRHLG